MNSDIRIRVLLAKPTQDCHDRGVRVLAKKMRDEGLEVIFMSFLLADEVVRTALDEDVSVVGVSTSTGGHMPLMKRLMRGFADNGLTGLTVLVGGVIPQQDEAALINVGVDRIFGPGSSAKEAIDFIRSRALRIS